MAMTLNNVPLSGQTLGNTRVPINQNFVTIDTAFQVDHVPYVTSGQGKHNKVTFPNQTSTPTFVASEMGMFNQLKNPTPRQDIWIIRGDDTGNPYPMTGYNNKSPASSAPTNGWTYIPSGMIMAWGTATITASNGLYNVNYASELATTNFPGFNSFYSPPIVVRFSNAPPPVSNFVGYQANSLTGFSAFSSLTTGIGSGVVFGWMVIGI